MLTFFLTSALLGAAPACGPLDLDTALGLALSRSDEVAIKESELAAAQVDESLARALRIAPLASATVVLGPSPEAKGTILEPKVGTSRSLSGLRPFGRVDVNVVQPLYTWGRLDAASEAAQAGVRARQDLVLDTASQVQLRVVQLYWGVALAKRLLVIAADVKDALDKADKHLTQALAEGDAEASPADKYRLDLFRGVVQGRTADAQKGLDLARIGLAATLGVAPPQLALKEERLEAGPGEPPPAAAAVASAQQQRPDLLALGEAIAARDAEVRAERAAAKPQFFLGAQFAYSYAPNRDIQLNPWAYDPFNTLSIGGVIGFKQDLAFPTLSARADKALAERAALERQRDGLVRLVQVQVDSALAELTAARTRFGASQAALGSGRSLFRSAGLDFEAGLNDAKTLIEAYGAYVESQVNAAQATYDLLVARAKLAQVTGEAPRKGPSCTLP